MGELRCDVCADPAKVRHTLNEWETRLSRRAVAHSLREQRNKAATAAAAACRSSDGDGDGRRGQGSQEEDSDADGDTRPSSSSLVGRQQRGAEAQRAQLRPAGGWTPATALPCGNTITGSSSSSSAGSWVQSGNAQQLRAMHQHPNSLCLPPAHGCSGSGSECVLTSVTGTSAAAPLLSAGVKPLALAGAVPLLQRKRSVRTAGAAAGSFKAPRTHPAAPRLDNTAAGKKEQQGAAGAAGATAATLLQQQQEQQKQLEQNQEQLCQQQQQQQDGEGEQRQEAYPLGQARPGSGSVSYAESGAPTSTVPGGTVTADLPLATAPGAAAAAAASSEACRGVAAAPVPVLSHPGRLLSRTWAAGQGRQAFVPPLRRP